MNRPAKVAVGLMACGLVGCTSDKTLRESATRPSIAPTEPRMLSVTARRADGGDPRDAQPQLRAMVHLDIYMHDMSAGAVSSNSEFWKKLDEQAFGAAEADRLKNNGIRCGIAPASEWVHFENFFAAHPNRARKMYMDGLRSESIELPLEKHFDQEDLFFYSLTDRFPEGRSYADGENLLALKFGPAPRNPTAIHLALCPVVRSHKTRLQFTLLNQEYETPINDVDRLYDLGLSFDLPDGSFFIISPGPEASRRTSVGACFLESADKAEMLEQVIVVVPTLIQLDGSPAMHSMLSK